MNINKRNFSLTLIRNEEPVTIFLIEGDTLTEILAKFPLFVKDMQEKISHKDFEDKIRETEDDDIPF